MKREPIVVCAIVKFDLTMAEKAYIINQLAEVQGFGASSESSVMKGILHPKWQNQEQQLKNVLLHEFPEILGVYFE